MVCTGSRRCLLGQLGAIFSAPIRAQLQNCPFPSSAETGIVGAPLPLSLRRSSQCNRATSRARSTTRGNRFSLPRAGPLALSLVHADARPCRFALRASRAAALPWCQPSLSAWTARRLVEFLPNPSASLPRPRRAIRPYNHPAWCPPMQCAPTARAPQRPFRPRPVQIEGLT